MKFAIYGENVTVNDQMREKIEQRLSDLNKYVVIDEEQSAKVTVKVYGGGLKVEVNVPTKVGLMRSEVVHEDFSTAVDLAIDKLEDQIRRQKGRLSRRHKDSLARLQQLVKENLHQYHSFLFCLYKQQKILQTIIKTFFS